ncbi:hypothetical protein [Nocardioides sp. GXQ0305]|uniref:hypothetical protein n=1 Tax=Nocardioides sp. GXQ0305 TaxID=3423912 RepID=UPI003D7E2BD5
MTVTTAPGPEQTGHWVRDELVAGARTLGTISAVGVLAGWFVVGVLSRLAMLLLAILNPVATGVTSDDGFVMGQFTLSGSLNLLFLAGTPLGLLGAGLYAAVRGLRIGPAWFRLLSVSVGAGLVVGSQLVHVDGVDFRLLEPLWLAIGLFVLLPIVFVAVLSAVSEWLLARPVPTPLVVAGLAAWLVVFPLLPLVAALAIGLVGLRLVDRTAVGHRVLGSPVGPWVLRAALAVVFVAAVVELVGDVTTLA